ncbi:MAG: hypothetical protein CVT74_17160 [Alphaproteobacteria bacterium HGW-Alphaproteobacteria-13]|nr:MAG: hypothetical protein CVT74_17160 [Alphaproteobacteria bacterium HGW-Alphaproteobacteria-13]
MDSLLDFERAPEYPKPKAEDFDGGIMAQPTEEARRELMRARRTQDEDALARIRQARQERQRLDRGQIARMRRWWLGRMIETGRPLEEKLTLFWHGHFATSYRTIENSYHLFLQNELFRRHAAGSFAGLLRSIIRDPAMLAYLDNNENRKGRPNENLARELMELFTLGEGAYAERDIKEGARALTGYSFEGNGFVFRGADHDDGPKSILGRSGRLTGDDFVAAVLEKPACADFIASRVYRFFVGEIPPKGDPKRAPVVGLVRSLAGTLRAARYEMKPMLRRLFLSEHFHDREGAPARIKSPAELVVGAVRSLRTPTRDLGELTRVMEMMGQSLFFPPSVAGWEGGRSWINSSTLFARANALRYLLTGQPQGGDGAPDGDERYDPAPMIEGLDHRARAEPALLARELLNRTLCVETTPEKEKALAGYLRSLAREDLSTAVAGALSLVTAMPEYQLC